MREKLIQFLEKERQTKGDNAIKAAQIARELKISEAAISQYLSGKYKGNNEKIDKLVESFLNVNAYQVEEKTNRYDFEFVETSIYDEISAVVKTILRNREMRSITGKSGIGKTTAIKYLKGIYGNRLIHFEAYQGITKRAFMQRLGRALGVEGRLRSFDEMFSTIEEKLKGWHGVIVIDEVEHVSISSIDAVRRLHEFANCGVVFIGLPVFNEILRRNRWDFEYIYNRLSIPGNLKILKAADVEKMAATMTDYNPGGKKWLECSKGIGRDLKFIVREFIRLSQRNPNTDKEIILNEVVKLLAR